VSTTIPEEITTCATSHRTRNDMGVGEDKIPKTDYFHMGSLYNFPMCEILHKVLVYQAIVD
jgi:hypothetical protein